MKRVLIVLVSVLLLSVSIPAYAAGNLSVTQENFYVISDYWTYGYAFAKITNVGDKAIKVNSGVIEIYDEAGNALVSNDYLHSYAECLEPGEYTYVKMYGEITSGTAVDHALTVTGKSDNTQRTLRLPVETDLQLNVTDGWWTYNYMYATVTNNTEEPLYNITVVLALLDADGNILDIEEGGLFSDVALAPGSTAIIREDIPSSFIKYFEENGLVPASVDAIAYVNLAVE